MRRPLVLALAIALLPVAGAHAEDLLQTYQLARTGDPQLAAAESTRLATREGAVQARALLLPQITGDASINRSRSSGPSSQSQFDQSTGQPVRFSGDSQSDVTRRSIGLNLNQTLFNYGQITNLRSQNAISRASDFQLRSAGDTLVTRTSAAYFNVLVAIETLAAAEASGTALKKQFDFASKRLEVGLAPITDVHEARAQYESARANTIVTRNALEDAYQALTEITGTPVRNLKGLPEDFKPALPSQRSADDWVKMAIAHNPALTAKQFQVESAEDNVATARAAHLPTLSLNGSYGRDASWGTNSFSSSNPPIDSTLPIDSQSHGPSVGITLSVPIFSGGATQSRVRQALAQRDIATDELEQQKRALVRNTRNSYQTLVAGISEVEARRLALVSAQVGLEVGTRTVLDVLNNQQTLFNAEREFALARYNFLQSRLLLEQSAGTLDITDVQDINRMLTADAEAQLAPGAGLEGELAAGPQPGGSSRTVTSS